MGLNIIGVTGTNGKTTVTYMLRSIFEKNNISCGIIGTTGHSFGNVKYEAVNTTPGAELLDQLLKEMEQGGITCCIMEVSSHGLAQDRVKNINFQYGIFTNLTQDHLDYHKTLENYFEAKKKLFNMTSKANIINIDDEYGLRIVKDLEKEKNETNTITYSLKDKKANYYCEIAETTERGSKFNLYENGKLLGALSINMPGIFMIYNSLASIACARENNISFEVIKEGCQELKGVPGRFQLVENSSDIIAIVDYAHTPDALEKVLKTATDFKRGKIICVFGCGGDRDKKKRPIMGKVVGEYCDYAIITSDNPRTEDQQIIAAEIEEGIYHTGCNYEIIKDRYNAIKKAIEIYKKGDIIIVAGKGHETYQIIGKEKFYFDDREALQEIIKNYGE
ncbi:UDP-N-acetylmuramoyl-L-alanyl-D-glutamate--2,6-diaminopimelate ligase [Anaerovorax odorimutans]|uniref:UDP-N-acetylmuramoyl-L-alanyl-D-glutamate--2, 6-diaminopimelate ligase n=1 Tax=Anaerovorax odorimutans TaxID=109327 RepID=UPI00041A6688|nr:UDP-N-acetylmuramoyl-L-alanyl-D-glutamate--2,6-diaminopimelate ligase [Anaerovorax odorimutans]